MDKGCPFNGFGPCKKGECKFYIMGRGVDNCIIIDQYGSSILDRALLIDLVVALSHLNVLEVSDFPSERAYAEHVENMRVIIDNASNRLGKIKKIMDEH